MKSTGARSSNELQWLDLKIGHQDSSPSNVHQGNMPYLMYWFLGQKNAYFITNLHTEILHTQGFTH